MNIYLDHAATTPVRPEVLEAMLPYFMEMYGNPSSIHAYGREANLALNRSRDSLAELLGCAPMELIFTGSGSESDNLAILGAVAASSDRGHIITTQVEHYAVLHACRQLERMGYQVTYLPVDEFGTVRVADVEQALRPDTLLVTIMLGNNEVGSLQPITEIGHMLQGRNILFHSDAVQALGSIPLQLREMPVDLMSFSAHKVNGPKGVGLLYCKAKTRLSPLIHGGSQERKRRAGTENMAGIVGLTRAVELATSEMSQKNAYYTSLRSDFIGKLTEKLGSEAWIRNGHPEHNLPHILNLSFTGISAETMLMNMDLAGIAASSGSACTSGSLEPSHVLQAMEIGEERVRSAIRFSFGYGHVYETVTFAAEKIATIAKRLRTKE